MKTSKLTKTVTQTVRDQIKQKYPEAYFVAGVGWCGPQWEAAMMWERAFTTQEREQP